MEILGNYSETWNGEALDIADINASYESQATMHHSRYGPMRAFGIPGDKSFRYSYHIKLPEGIRVYIHGIRFPRQILVGYIGRHLSTVSDP